MLYDPYGRLVPENTAGHPVSGMQIVMSPARDRDGFDASRGLTPVYVDRILLQANGGDVEAQCRLARELPEKNAAVAHALRTRRNAVAGREWHIEPGDESDAAQSAAKRLEGDLKASGCSHPALGRLGSFSRLLRDLTDAILPGFAASEIVWRPGGAGFYGFRAVDQRFLSFTQSYTPRLRVDGNLADGITLPPGKLIFHELGDNGSDPVRGGLIRPLAWLHCFGTLALKDLLAFIERYGMPFVRASVDQATWEKEQNTLNQLICNFGPSGGGVFSKNTEVELLQAPNTSGEAYFRLIQYLDDAVTKVLLGQTASSGDSAGLSGGDAQSRVRADIMEADARALEDTINRDLFACWTEYNCPPGTPAPRLKIETGEPEDLTALANTATALFNAGLDVDPDEMSERFGQKLTRRVMPDSAGTGGIGGIGMPGFEQGGQPEADADAAHTLNLKQKYDAMGVAIRAGLLTATPEIEAQTRTELGLPGMTPEVRKAWDATGGIRQPITLKTAEAEAVSDALNVDVPKAAKNMELADTPGGERKDDAPTLADALEAWLGPVADGIAAAAELPDDELDRKLRSGAIADAGDMAPLEKILAADMERAYYGDKIQS